MTPLDQSNAKRYTDADMRAYAVNTALAVKASAHGGPIDFMGTVRSIYLFMVHDDPMLDSVSVVSSSGNVIPFIPRGTVIDGKEV